MIQEEESHSLLKKFNKNIQSLLNHVMFPKIVDCNEGMTLIGQTPLVGGKEAAEKLAAVAHARENGLPQYDKTSQNDTISDLSVKKVELEEALSNRPNPGSYELADQLSKNILNPEIFDGLKMCVKKSFSQKFMTMHDFFLGSQMIPSGSSYAFSVQSSLSDNLHLISRGDLQGNVFANIILDSEKISTRLISQTSQDQQRSIFQGECEYKGSDFTGNLKLASGMGLTLSYFQSLSKSLALGGEGRFSPDIGNIIACRGRYSTDNNQFNVSLSNFNILNASYLRKVSEKVSLTCEYETKLDSSESVMNLGWDFTLHLARVNGCLNSDGILFTQIQHMIDPTIVLMLSAQSNFSSDLYRFGYGFQLG